MNATKSGRRALKRGLKGMTVVLLLLLVSAAALCFCSLLPLIFAVSFVFNGFYLGSSLFAALAQEKEKRTIDALRLTQLSASEILLHKASGEFTLWKIANAVLMSIATLAAFKTGAPILWALATTVSLAASGLVSMALALAVSTRCDTTSSAVVTGWVAKLVWFAGLPVLDFVLEAVLVMKRELSLLSFLDPAWVLLNSSRAIIFETSGNLLVATFVGAVGSVFVALALVKASARLIDTSFEAAATLEDRNRHSIYGRELPFGLHKNPFLIRELAWQMRSGAGAWPGYAVFITLFLAPFFYGLAQYGRQTDRKPVRIVRQSVATPQAQSNKQPMLATSPSTSAHQKPGSGMSCVTPEPTGKLHSHMCLSRMMGLPVPYITKNHCGSEYVKNPSSRTIIMNADGRAEKLSDREARLLRRDINKPKRAHRKSINRSRFERELDRGLFTGLALCIIYLFIRGGAFMSGAVTGEKERRAWDQIALTGVEPSSYLFGKMGGVLYYPLKQLMMTVPLLLLFSFFGKTSLVSVLLFVPLLALSFLAASSLGLLSSSIARTSHEAQAMVLVMSALLLMAPMMSGSALMIALATFGGLAAAKNLSSLEKLMGALGMGGLVAVFGENASPLVAVMKVCGYNGYEVSPGHAVISIIVACASLSVVARGSYLLAQRQLNHGDSLDAN